MFIVHGANAKQLAVSDHRSDLSHWQKDLIALEPLGMPEPRHDLMPRSIPQSGSTSASTM
jgi:hypothetical protein